MTRTTLKGMLFFPTLQQPMARHGGEPRYSTNVVATNEEAYRFNQILQAEVDKLAEQHRLHRDNVRQPLRLKKKDDWRGLLGYEAWTLFAQSTKQPRFMSAAGTPVAADWFRPRDTVEVEVELRSFYLPAPFQERGIYAEFISVKLLDFQAEV